MKIMDVSTEDGECQIEKVVIADTEKEKQERMPFQTLGADSVVANKKRKSATSLGSTKAKLAKITKRTTKENSFKKSKNVISEEAHETVQNSDKKSESDASKESSKKGEQSEGQDSKNKKSTPGKGKTKKTEVKPQSNAITKFLKKVDPQENQARKIVVTAIIENDKNHLKTDEEKKIETKPEDGAKPEQNGVEEIAPTETANHQQDSEKKSNGELAGHPMETEEKSNDDDNQPMEIEKKTNGDVEENSESSKESVEVNESNGQKKSGLIGFNQSLKAIHASDACKSDNVDSDSDIISVSGDSHDCDSSRIDSDLKRTDCDDTDNKTNADRSMESTPKRNKLLDGPLKVKKLTPKQIERKMEIQKKKEMRQKQRLEREQKLQEERESRKKEKEDKKREREEKEKALKEQKKREKEIKEQRKAIDIELKQKEKEAREEDRRKREEAKEEERKRKEEEKLEAERKKQKAASNFVSFFVAKKPSEPKPSEEEKEIQNQNFMPFEIKADMRVAPVVRRALTSDEKSNLDNVLNSDVDKCRLYIRAIKDKKYNVGKSSKTWPFEACDDVLIIEDEAESANIIRANVPIEKHRAKLFLFEENRRPPYYGTWRKQSKFVKPRRPFAKDSVSSVFLYYGTPKYGISRRHR
ncbi:hypothetical protein QAD02_005665 [Eretmocerus hayati]|uniref:Uncharacterized protein n=1 Tax=Eretmocerus hayati TaxID=131215 RepID=A0ACC2NU64_9HYME|nr:hypothetical protein QAD02_005665 [Eretmocerus hayati]